MRVLPSRRAARSQRGVILILTLFVLFLVIAMVTQLSLGAQVAHTATVNRAVDTRMRMAAASAAEEVLTLIKDDATGNASSGLASALAGPGAFDGFDPGAMEGLGADQGFGADPGLGADGQDPAAEGEGEEDASNSDSFEDAWAKPMRLTMGDLEVTTFVQDENGKYNILALVSGDDEAREEAFERTVRILDQMREDFDDDLQEFEARSIVENIRRYMETDSRTTDLPLMPRNSLEDEDLETRLQSLEELMLVERITPEMYYDQLREDRIAPGLQTVFTIWTVPEYDPPSAGEGAAGAGASGPGAAVPGLGAAAGADPNAAAGPGAGADPNDPNRVVEGEGGLEGALEGEAPIGILVNLNTAHPAVLYGMFPTTRMPPVKITNLLEWRNEVDQEALDERESADEDPEDIALRESVYGVDEEDPKQFLTSLEGISQIDGFSQEQLDPEVQAELQSLFGVQSDVFRVCLYIRQTGQEPFVPERRYQEPSGRTLRLEATVWRRMAGDEVKILFLEPWHEVPYTRWRIPDFQRDLPPFRPPRYE